ncbi:hypothetical protein [Streptomyces sp. ODS28]|uniref:hypothetical protein n=1 Tax=Streptomyces sp. ODS28 TaxID=3136688 RepID=UPI0031F00B1A
MELNACWLTDGLTAQGVKLPEISLDECLIERAQAAPVNCQRACVSRLSMSGTTVIGTCEDGAVWLEDAEMSRMSLEKARLRNTTGPALDADGAHITGNAYLDDLKATSESSVGTVLLCRVCIGGVLDCSEARLRNTSTGPALAADGASITDNIYLSRLKASSASSRGTIRLIGTQVGGQLSCQESRLRNADGPALQADGLKIEHNMWLTGLKAWSKSSEGTIRLRSARVGGQFGCENARFHSTAGSALDAPYLNVGGTAFSQGLRATSKGRKHSADLEMARIAETFDCRESRLRNTTGSALNAEGLEVGQDFLFNGSVATSRGEYGTVRLLGARIGHQLHFFRARLHNTSTGPALTADGLRVTGKASFDSIVASSKSEHGTLRLAGARLGGQLVCVDARLRCSSGPAVMGQDLHVTQSFFLRGKFTAACADDGTMNLNGASITGRLSCNSVQLRNSSGPALVAISMCVGKDLILAGDFEARGSGEAWETLVLRGACITGRLEFAPARLENTASSRHLLDIDGMTYTGLPLSAPLHRWLDWLRRGTGEYAAQPYQQLAAVHRAAGHDHDVRRILMTQREDQLARGRALSGRWDRAWGRLTGLTLGYGYQPWRALLFLLAVALIALTLALSLGTHGALVRAAGPGKGTVECSTVQQVSVGLELGLPLVKAGIRRCVVTDSGTGQALAASGLALQGLSWAFATLFVAGFTGAVRKSP